MTELLHIAPPTPRFPREVLDSAGGFIWWYVDVIDAHGDGLVLIWSFGLPFLPGYAGSARRGAPTQPRERPSLAVAVMQEHELACYVLHEFEPDEVEWSGESWRFGENLFDTAQEDGVRTLRVQLDCPLPGELALRGTVELSGVARRAQTTDTTSLHHDWAPMTGPTSASVRLSAGSERYNFDGRGYFDGNAGVEPLHDTGIDRWTWGRLPAADAEVIYYVLWPDADDAPQAYGVVIDGEGQLTRHTLEVEVLSERIGRAGLRFPAAMRLRLDGETWWTVDAAQIVDDGPFYLRYFINGKSNNGEHVRGIGEFCRTDRIDVSWQRPLVRMRVQRGDGRNSIWLPLFTGPKRGRVGRLLRQFVGS